MVYNGRGIHIIHSQCSLSDVNELLLELLKGTSIEKLDMGLKYRVFTTFMDQSLILTSYKKLLIL